jgi:tRNA nucleotidyltransferase (CCA-adding enzyme)
MAKPLTRPNIALLTASLAPTARALFEVARSHATDRGLELWAVGGLVRDAATGHPIADVDLATDREAGALAEAIAAQTSGTATFEARFGTASVEAGNARLDLAAIRSERYARPGVLPDVSIGAPIEDDLERRDFSVNAIALGLTGTRRDQLLDPFSGLDDLAAGRFRVLHDRSFEDDATRVWRAARLSAHHDLRPTPATHVALIEGARWLSTISGDRLWTEFALIAERGRAARTLALLDAWGVLAATSAALALGEAAATALRHRWRPLPAARLAAVLLATSPSEAADAAHARLNAPATAIRAVHDARSILAARNANLAQLEVLAHTQQDGRIAARWLDPAQAELQRELQRWERCRPHLNAHDLLNMGVPQGPDLGAWLDCLRRRRYLGTLGSVAEARTLVRHQLDQAKGVP